MERTYTWVIVVIIAAIGLFGVRLMTGGDAVEDEGMPLARASRDRSAGNDGRDGGSDGSGSRGSSRRAGESSRGSAGDPEGYRDSKDRRHAGGSRSAPALVARSQRGEAGGVVGSAGGRGATGGERTALSPFGEGGARRLDSNDPRRAGVVEYLASQPATGRQGDAGEGSDGDVALEVKRPEDTEPALVSKGVDGADNDEGLTFDENSQLAFPDGGNVNTDEGTLAFSITPNWSGSDESNNSLVTWREEHAWSNRIELVKNGRYLRFILSDNVGREADISVPIDAWIPGEEHDVKATWGSQQTSLYIDGKLVGQNSYVEFKRPNAPLYIGSDHRGSSYSGLNGVMRGFKATNTASHSS